MTLVLSTDLGTTKITAVAVDTGNGQVVAHATTANRAEQTTAASKARGYSEWDARPMAELALDCLRGVADQLGAFRDQVAGIGITGQQHGVVVVGPNLTPLTPFINWQDRRGAELTPWDPETTYVRHLQDRAGVEVPARTGCRLATGYQGVTLFWLKQNGVLPANGLACFMMDYFASLLTGTPPVTDPTCAASSGVFNVRENEWDWELIDEFQLPRSLFVPVRASGDTLGGLTSEMARHIGLRAGVPVCVGIGDNQASFLGSVARRQQSLLVNVGTGGQVAAFHAEFAYDASLETRPFPRGGYLLVSAGLCGGAAYAALERFFRGVGQDLFLRDDDPLYAPMNTLAGAIPRGADGLRCEPFFAGTRAQPELRGEWTGVSTTNFTPAHFTRALLEGMARTFRAGAGRILAMLREPRAVLVGAGNGLRENAVLARIVAEEMGQPLHVVTHSEEAAYGAALLAAVGTGIFPGLHAAGTLIRYGDAVTWPDRTGLAKVDGELPPAF